MIGLEDSVESGRYSRFLARAHTRLTLWVFDGGLPNTAGRSYTSMDGVTQSLCASQATTPDLLYC
ncbi:hypothetical protein PCAR4_830119 [Paraburkholderia caribensis]|nr:hypothetical protein PCAR4_830119 [Paraburkholderia caribensis]